MTTALKFRNIDASPDDPVETWPFEGILAAVDFFSRILKPDLEGAGYVVGGEADKG